MRALAAGLVLLLAATTTYAQVNCLIDTGSGKIDLTQIPQKALVMTQTYQGANTDHVFKFNLCTASGEPPQGAENCNKNSFVGEWGTNGGCEAQFDAVSQQPMYNNGAVTIGYYNQNGWTATITLKCGGTPLESGGVVAVSEQLQFTFQLASQYVCGGPPPTGTNKPTDPTGGPTTNPSNQPGSGGGLTWGGVMVIILSVVLVVYVGGMVAFAYFRQNKRGKELIPNPDFWSSIPGLVKDGCKFSYEKARSLTSRGGSSGGYQPV